ncbi:DUF5133 domain-containing protein, partial [Streptomyces olivaceus]
MEKRKDPWSPVLTRYASLRIAQAERETPAAARELADASYTLC